jgi:hypothetical protein
MILVPIVKIRQFFNAVILIFVSFTLASCAVTTTTAAKPAPSIPVIKTPLQDWGATQASWQGDHTLDPILKTGYWPRLASGVDTYTNITYSNNIVTGFTYNFYPGVTLAVARETAKGMLPIATKTISKSPKKDVYSFAGATITVTYIGSDTAMSAFVLSSPAPPDTTFQ